MNFQDYMASVDKRCKVLPFDQHLTHMGLGVIGEIGELADAAKKTSIYGKTMDVVHFKEEVGDAAWYVVGYGLKVGSLAPELEAAYARGLQDYAEDTEYKSMTDGDFMAVVAFAAAACVVSLMDYRPYDEQAEYELRDARVHVENLMNTLGMVCARYRFDISEVFDMNDAKLDKRYGQKFSGEAALNRDVAAERAVMEGRQVASGFTSPSPVSDFTSPSPVSDFTVQGQAEFTGYPPASPLVSAPDHVWDVTKGRFVHRNEVGKE